jgi:hypothetical protein
MRVITLTIAPSAQRDRGQKLSARVGPFVACPEGARDRGDDDRAETGAVQHASEVDDAGRVLAGACVVALGLSKLLFVLREHRGQLLCRNLG